jgi:hypothetical protein
MDFEGSAQSAMEQQTSYRDPSEDGYRRLGIRPRLDRFLGKNFRSGGLAFLLRRIH